MRNCILLTGLPRSGTTLTCHLLNKLPGTIALHEPMNAAVLSELPGAPERVAMLREFIQDVRSSLLRDGTAISKHANGIVPDNSRASDLTEAGLRRTTVKKGVIHFDKQLNEDFQLVLKHPTAFCAMLGEISDEFVCAAIVRNPLAVLGSWNSVDMAVRRGHVPTAESIDPMLANALRKEPDLYERQLFILDWFFERILRYVPGSRIIRYESMIASAGRDLQVINPLASTLREPLESRNYNALYDTDVMQRLGDALLRRKDGAYWNLYRGEDVESLMRRT